MKILICSKPSDDQQLLVDFFDNANNRIQMAETAAHTLQLFAQWDPDCIFIDVDDAEIDGYQTAKKIRELCDEDSQSIPIYFLGKRPKSTAIQQEIEAGGDDYLMKPLSLMVLKDKAGSLLRTTLLRQHLIVSRMQLRDANEKLRSLNQMMAELSFKDPLTRLENRRAFEESFEKISGIAMRENKPLSVLVIDIDRFKNFNNHFGVPAGDRLLQQIGTILKRNLHRGSDVTARIAGGTFAAILLDTPMAGGMHVAERIRKAIAVYEIPNPVDEKPEMLTISIGLSYAQPCTKESSHAMIATAEQALVEAKDAGRNCAIAVNASGAAQDENDLSSSPQRRSFSPKHSQSKH